jgi:hypothetical protein
VQTDSCIYLRYKGTKAQRHKGTKAQRHKGTKAQRRKGAKAQRHKGTKAQRHKGTKAQRQKFHYLKGIRRQESGRLIAHNQAYLNQKEFHSSILFCSLSGQ